MQQCQQQMQEYIKKILGSGHCTSHNRSSSSTLHNNAILIISNDEMKDIIRIVESLEDSDLLMEGVSKAIQNEVNEQKRGFSSMLLGTLGPSLLENISK